MQRYRFGIPASFMVDIDAENEEDAFDKVRQFCEENESIEIPKDDMPSGGVMCIPPDTLVYLFPDGLVTRLEIADVTELEGE